MHKFILAIGFVFVSSIAYAETAAKIVVFKSERKMELLDKSGRVLKSYRIALGGNPIGPKTREGDRKTPEGHYTINGRNPNSRFHYSLSISYPNAADISRAVKVGTKKDGLGGDIMIHGLRNGTGFLGSLHLDRLAGDWTDGCIAVRNSEIDEIKGMVPNGTPIDINP